MGVDTTTITEWEKVRSRLVQKLCSSFYGTITISARVYGATRKTSHLTVLAISERVLPQSKLKELKDLCHGLKFIHVCQGRRSIINFPHSHAKRHEYEDQLTHGDSIGVWGHGSSGSFGGYISLNNSVYGMTCCHCIVPDFKKIAYPAPSDGSTSNVVSPSDRDYIDFLNDLVNEAARLRTLIGPRNATADEKIVIDNVNAKITKTKLITSVGRIVGRVVASSGETVGDNSQSLTCNWALFDVAPSRLAENRFPATHFYPQIPTTPRKIGQPIQEYWKPEEGKIILQAVCYVGRTSGFSRGYTRVLKTVRVDWGSPKTPRPVLIYGWSFALSSSDYDGPPGPRPGDSGSWVYECDFGRPIAQLTWSDGIEGTAVALEDVFDEIEDHTGYRPRLP